MLDERGRDQVGATDGRRARADEQDPLVGHPATRDPQCGADSGQHDCRGSLDVVVEAAHPIAVALEQAECVLVGEILELDQRVRKDRADRIDELVDKLVVVDARCTPTPQPQVQRIVDQLLSVRAHVESHRQTARRVDSGARRVESELADRNAHAVRAEVAEPEDALAIGHHDHPDVLVRPVAEQLAHPAPVVARDEHPTRPAEDVTVLLAGAADGRGVDQRHQLFEMIDHHAVEQRLVPVLQTHQIAILLERTCLLADVLHHAAHLVALGLESRRQKAAQTEGVTFGGVESGSLVELRVVEKLDTCRTAAWIRARHRKPPRSDPANPAGDGVQHIAGEQVGVPA